MQRVFGGRMGNSVAASVVGLYSETWSACRHSGCLSASVVCLKAFLGGSQ